VIHRRHSDQLHCGCSIGEGMSTPAGHNRTRSLLAIVRESEWPALPCPQLGIATVGSGRCDHEASGQPRRNVHAWSAQPPIDTVIAETAFGCASGTPTMSTRTTNIIPSRCFNNGSVMPRRAPI